MKKILTALLAVCLLLSLCACGGEKKAEAPAAPVTQAPAASSTETQSAGPAAPAEPKILKMAVSFFYTSLDAHKDWNGWNSSIYGLSETLFKVGNDMGVQPLLADSAEAGEGGRTWTIKLNPNAAFSTGKALTADMVARNLQRVAQVNERFADMQPYVYNAVDDTTLTITTPEPYPTLITDKLANSAFGIIDLDDSADLDNAPICTGPFKVKSFKTEGTVELDKNENYWNGPVKLDGVIFYFMNDDETKLMAMQSGEIDGYTSVTAAARQIYEADPDHYTVTVIPATRLQFYVLNQHRLSPNIRRAIDLTVDSAAIAEYLGGTVSPAVGPFSAGAPYGQVTKPAVDLEAARAAIEADGYTMNADGYYEKDGKVLTVNVSYYFARSLDTIALLLDGQFKQVGIKIDPVGVEDADSTYRVSADYDMALYCMVADSAGDPYYCINALFRQSSDWAKGGFKNDACEALINQLQAESDTAKRADLANRIVQMVIDDDAFGFIGLFNKITVAAPGVVNIGEYSPLDCYAVSAETDMP